MSFLIAIDHSRRRTDGRTDGTGASAAAAAADAADGGGGGGRSQLRSVVANYSAAQYRLLPGTRRAPAGAHVTRSFVRSHTAETPASPRIGRGTQAFRPDSAAAGRVPIIGRGNRQYARCIINYIYTTDCFWNVRTVDTETLSLSKIAPLLTLSTPWILRKKK